MKSVKFWDVIQSNTMGWIGVCAFIWFMGHNTLFDCIDFAKLKNLTPSNSSFALLSMERSATPDENRAGRVAMAMWKDADDTEKWRYIVVIVVGKVLQGMRSHDVLEALGEPTRTLQRGGRERIEYSTEEMYCPADRTLIIDCEDNRVQKVYLKWHKN